MSKMTDFGSSWLANFTYISTYTILAINNVTITVSSQTFFTN